MQAPVENRHMRTTTNRTNQTPGIRVTRDDVDTALKLVRIKRDIPNCFESQIAWRNNIAVTLALREETHADKISTIVDVRRRARFFYMMSKKKRTMQCAVRS